MNENLIELRHIGKRFGGVRALDDVSFAIKPGEIHCLAGENGSGKSTIIKVMSGVYTPEDGEILIDGKSVGKLADPVKSVHHGIQVIYQISLFGNLTVAENLAINTFLIEGRKGVDWKRVRDLAQKSWRGFDVSIDLDGCGQPADIRRKQIVAIARAVMADRPPHYHGRADHHADAA